MSLPEYDQSGRNWDYRYCWMRDTYYTLNAFNNLGHFEESEKYFHYIENIIASETQRIQPLYSITGQKKIIENILDLAGYQDNNTPVRIGNDAYTHIQNDVYGQVLVSLLPVYTDKRLLAAQHSRSKEIVLFLLNRIEATMFEPDAGLWEFRNLKQLHCYTFLLHWAGSKAALKIGNELGNETIISKAKKLIDLSAEQIEKCYIPEKQAYGQAIGSKYLDASCLELITMNYLDPQSDKAKNHLKALEAELKTEKGLFYRYKHEDDFGVPHTTFLICAFWYAEALACVGRMEDAVKVFTNLISYSNHLGILSEDVGTDGSQWGNFPQTYSHVGLMNTAFKIARKLDTPMFY
jgi:GH15 family glucan-1,4-alpha-glucosidase